VGVINSMTKSKGMELSSPPHHLRS